MFCSLCSSLVLWGCSLAALGPLLAPLGALLGRSWPLLGPPERQGEGSKGRGFPFDYDYVIVFALIVFDVDCDRFPTRSISKSIALTTITTISNSIELTTISNSIDSMTISLRQPQPHADKSADLCSTKTYEVL